MEMVPSLVPTPLNIFIFIILFKKSNFIKVNLEEVICKV